MSVWGTTLLFPGIQPRASSTSATYWNGTGNLGSYTSARTSANATTPAKTELCKAVRGEVTFVTSQTVSSSRLSCFHARIPLETNALLVCSECSFSVNLKCRCGSLYLYGRIQNQKFKSLLKPTQFNLIFIALKNTKAVVYFSTFSR